MITAEGGAQDVPAALGCAAPAQSSRVVQRIGSSSDALSSLSVWRPMWADCTLCGKSDLGKVPPGVCFGLASQRGTPLTCSADQTHPSDLLLGSLPSVLGGAP